MTCSDQSSSPAARAKANAALERCTPRGARQPCLCSMRLGLSGSPGTSPRGCVSPHCTVNRIDSNPRAPRQPLRDVALVLVDVVGHDALRPAREAHAAQRAVGPQEPVDHDALVPRGLLPAHRRDRGLSHGAPPHWHHVQHDNRHAGNIRDHPRARLELSRPRDDDEVVAASMQPALLEGTRTPRLSLSESRLPTRPHSASPPCAWRRWPTPRAPARPTSTANAACGETAHAPHQNRTAP